MKYFFFQHEVNFVLHIVIITFIFGHLFSVIYYSVDMSAIFISHPLIQLTHVIYPLSCSSHMVRCMLCIFIYFGRIKFKGSCRFIYSEGLLLVLEDRFITRHNLRLGNWSLRE